MGIHDSYHQNVILACIDDLVSHTFRESRVTECHSAADGERKFGDHKMVQYCVPLLEKCSTCEKYKRGSFSEGLLCRGKFIIRGLRANNSHKWTCISAFARLTPGTRQSPSRTGRW